MSTGLNTDIAPSTMLMRLLLHRHIADMDTHPKDGVSDNVVCVNRGLVSNWVDAKEKKTLKVQRARDSC